MHGLGRSVEVRTEAESGREAHPLPTRRLPPAQAAQKLAREPRHQGNAHRHTVERAVPLSRVEALRPDDESLPMLVERPLRLEVHDSQVWQIGDLPSGTAGAGAEVGFLAAE